MVAYIMTVTELGWEDALSTVRAARSCANPNLGFQQQLQDFQEHEVQQVSASGGPGDAPGLLRTPQCAGVTVAQAHGTHRPHRTSPCSVPEWAPAPWPSGGAVLTGRCFSRVWGPVLDTGWPAIELGARAVVFSGCVRRKLRLQAISRRQGGRGRTCDPVVSLPRLQYRQWLREEYGESPLRDAEEAGAILGKYKQQGRAEPPPSAWPGTGCPALSPLAYSHYATET